MTRQHLDERRQAFTGLLAQPVIGRGSLLWPVVRKHRPVLTEWFADRLGYRLVMSGEAARLYRLPLDSSVIAPPRLHGPPRRSLVLALLAAACAEDTDDLTTVQELSDRVRALAAREEAPVAPYEPDKFAERQLFVKAIDLLVELGVLAPTGRAGEEMLTGWARREDEIGGAYQVRRELLLRLIDPESLAAAVGRRTAAPTVEDHRRFTIMRRLLELPVCLMEDLTEPERAYLTSQRSRILGWCQEMTGWAAEQRREGIALIPDGDTGTDRPFPRVKADHFGALMILDHLLRSGTGGEAAGRIVDVSQIAGAAAEVVACHPKAMTTAFKEDPGRLADAAIIILAELDLLRPEMDAWRVMPPAARFRDPEVRAAQQRIEGEE
ncbi:TIGR02678 family protein [Thermomonospora echinospora]|uniref:TIGR02678 family protein n=1 Tax=Thermomonospora echinospora TaxID=1992 RepID=A0A1H6AXC9_9ACTN|nr:DUF2398 family protein [Thermomonospora echinospora]SEG52920.1 TIGR02678 family protein [Thermomonospora echinospora]